MRALETFVIQRINAGALVMSAVAPPRPAASLKLGLRRSIACKYAGKRVSSDVSINA